MAATEQLIFPNEYSVILESTVGMNERIIVEDLGGLMIFGVTGRSGGKTDLGSFDTVATAFERDAWKHDIADWIKQKAASGESLDPAIFTQESVEYVDLTADYKTNMVLLWTLKEDKAATEAPTRQDQVSAANKFIAKAIEEAGGTEAVLGDDELFQQIHRELQELPELSEEERAKAVARIEARIAELEPETEKQKQKLNVFEVKTTEQQRALVTPIKELVRLELITPELGYAGLVNRVVDFEAYGPVPTKMTVRVPRELHASPIPMSYEDATALADRITSEASVKTSIWDRTRKS